MFADNFNQGIPGWTSVQPRGIYWDGPLRWEFDIAKQAIVERSNIYTDNSADSTSAIAPMLINATVAEAPFTYSASLTAGDDDGFGLIFGYQNESNFYRVSFAKQSRGGFPRQGWTVDRKTNGVTSTILGPSTSFVNMTGRTFDVTLSVDALNQFTLQVVDDPSGTSTSYLLVDRQPLPTQANGQVGVFTWGMGGGKPLGFRIQNLSLTPKGLHGNLYGFLNWTPLVPPDAKGSTALVAGMGEDHWFLTANTNDTAGTLREDSDCYGAYVAPGQIDFTGPTIVAGDNTWSNYVVAVRVLPHDVHGQGLLLRYQNPSNFYRIALRQNQNHGTGVPPGLSVQKNVNRVYTEIYRDNPVKYNPALNVPYDLVAQIATNTLHILLVANPDGDPQVFTYGPFDLTGVDCGKIGLFSWAMVGVEYDRVSVQDGASLYVSSSLGLPSPSRGMTSFETGQWIEATAGVASNPPGGRCIVTGWVGSGSVPPSGTNSTVAFSIDTFSQLHWLWKTEFHLSVTNEIGGTVSCPPAGWLPAGTHVTVTAKPERGFLFVGWEGDSQSRSPTLNLTLDQSYELTATFAADRDDDGLADDWELAYWGNLSHGPDDDPDDDGQRALQEMDDGLDPNQPDILRIENVHAQSNTPRLAITNNTGTRYNVELSTSLSGGWTTVSSNQQADLSTIPLASGISFLRLAQPALPIEVPRFAPQSWSLVVLPDTQNYSWNNPDLFKDQTRWIVANKKRYNIQYVLHLGDIVDEDLVAQWTNANAALSILDGEVPYALVTGNHDYTAFFPARSTRINTYFPPSRFQDWPTFGGVKDAGRIENSYHLFSAGGVDWLVLALEFGPRNATVTWANSIIDLFPNHRVIVITHAYLYDDSTRYDWATKGGTQLWNPHSYALAYDPDGTNDGEELWQKLIQGHSNVVFVLNGHVANSSLNGGVGRLASTNAAGNRVHQMLSNYQAKPLGGGAFFRLLEFRPNGKNVQVKTYSPYSGTYTNDFRNQFMLTLQPPLPEVRR